MPTRPCSSSTATRPTSTCRSCGRKTTTSATRSSSPACTCSAASRQRREPEHGCDPQHAQLGRIGRRRHEPRQLHHPTTHDLSVHQSSVGTTWGLAYDASAGKLYASAFLKRHSGLGTGGVGAIYQTGLTGTTAGLYADLNSIFVDNPAGNLNDVFRDQANNPVAFNRNYTDVQDWARDGLVRFVDVNGVTRDLGWDAVGKLSLGGLANNADNTKLYTVALGDRRLYSLPTGGALTTATVRGSTCRCRRASPAARPPTRRATCGRSPSSTTAGWSTSGPSTRRNRRRARTT